MLVGIIVDVAIYVATDDWAGLFLSVAAEKGGGLHDYVVVLDLVSFEIEVLVYLE